MTHYVDLSPCGYFGHGSGLPPLELIAVGWLERGFDYGRGDPGRAVYERLEEFIRVGLPDISFMGWHDCGLCRYEGFHSGKNIFIPADGITYASPEGIVHYIGSHDYLPPEQFCSAVLACPPAGSPEYFSALRASGWPRSMAKPEELSPEVRHFRHCLSIAQPRGKAIVAAIDAYCQAEGRLPETLDDAVRLVDNVGDWTYSVRYDTYTLSAKLQLAPGHSRLLFHHSAPYTPDA